MKRILAILLALVMTAGCAEAARYRIAEENEETFGLLLDEMLAAVEEPGAEHEQAMEAALEAIREKSETDYEIADRIAAHWKRVYLDPEYELYLHDGRKEAESLKQTEIPDSAEHAFVVLGYALKNGKMTSELRGRCDAAAAAARAFPETILVCTGGATGSNNPEMHTEAGLMKEYLTERKRIKARRIFTDERAMTTVDNARNTFRILKKRGVRSMTIVTSDYHQKWGQAVYNAVGALYSLETGYCPEIIGNYSFRAASVGGGMDHTERIAISQIRSILGLPRKTDGQK